MLKLNCIGIFENDRICEPYAAIAGDQAYREADLGIVFAGDSPNDAPMFDFFPNSVGVANVLHFKNSLPVSPT